MGNTVPDPNVRAKTADEYTVKMALLKRVANDFTYHSPKGDQINRYAEIRDLGKQLANLIVMLTPVSREQAMALTLLEQATMMANAAIARNEQASKNRRTEKAEKAPDSEKSGDDMLDTEKGSVEQ